MRTKRWSFLLVLFMILGLLAMAAPAGAHEDATIKLGQHPTLGTILTDRDGMTLYLFTRDEVGKSNCYGNCEKAWPPLFAEEGHAAALAHGIPGTLGTTARTDGKLQVTYDGMPLYYWVRDKAPGEATGQNVNTVWFVINPAITPTVQLTQHPTMGSVLVGPSGMTLYVYPRDKVGTSNCYGGCATNWPPLLVTEEPVAPPGLSGALGTTTRTDGTKQVTFNGMPLYYWVKDVKPGDTTGHLVGKVWFIAHPGQLLDAAGHWAEYDVSEGIKGGWVTGHPDGTFKPDSEVTRAEFAKMLTGAFGIAASTATGTFADTGSHWASGVIEAAVTAGIIKPAEYGGSMFQPDRAITRAEIATMVVRALGKDSQAAAAAAAADRFSDASTTGMAKGHVGLAVNLKVLGGFPDGTVRGDKSATRGQAVAMILRALKAK